MTIDEAIEIYERRANTHEREAEYHRPLGYSYEAIANVVEMEAREERQIAKWLKELKERKAEQTEPQYHADVECNYKDCDNCGHKEYCPQSKIDPQTDCTEALTLLWIKNMVTDEEFYRIDARLKCISCKWWNDTIVGGSECVSKECIYKPKDEPQTNKDFEVTYSCSFTDCDNFKNFGFSEKCIECKRKQSEAKYKPEPQIDC